MRKTIFGLMVIVAFIFNSCKKEEKVVSANFAVDNPTGESPLVIKFTNTSSEAESYVWDFGDGTPISTEKDPSHTFTNTKTTDMTYTVTLTAKNGESTSTFTKTVTVSKNDFIAAFTTDKELGDSPLEVKFTNTSSLKATTFLWDFGNGKTSTEKNPSRTFVSTSTIDTDFIIKLTAKSINGAESVFTKKITVNKVQLKSNFTADKESGASPLTIKFTNSSSNAASYAWDFGNGKTSTETNPTQIFTNSSFTVDSVYIVTLVAKSSENSTAAYQKNITVLKKKAIASFIPDKTLGDTPLEIAFTNTSTDAVSYLWNFGDNTTSTNKSPVHTFTNTSNTTDKEFTVTLTATNLAGGTASADTKITVKKIASTLLEIVSVSAISIKRGETLTITGKNFGSNGSISLGFIDGINPVITKTATVVSSTSVTYTIPVDLPLNTYKITLTTVQGETSNQFPGIIITQ